jgi:ATP-dependent protease Clp ATPase subunit
MFEIPTQTDVKGVVVNKDVIENRHKPKLIKRGERIETFSEDESA